MSLQKGPTQEFEFLADCRQCFNVCCSWKKPESSWNSSGTPLPVYFWKHPIIIIIIVHVCNLYSSPSPLSDDIQRLFPCILLIIFVLNRHTLQSDDHTPLPYRPLLSQLVDAIFSPLHPDLSDLNYHPQGTTATNIIKSGFRYNYTSCCCAQCSCFHV